MKNICIRNQFEKKFRAVSSDVSQSYAADEELSEEDEYNLHSTSTVDEDSSSEGELDQVFSSINSKSGFRRMRVFSYDYSFTL